ncbi:hypothetical protein Ahy_A04g020874 [Arachis hypogaea]|uniref:Uncharacterized protein n=1 Tax=Arachis hypogaea TaxID=3818 RepID=A0A445DIR5_ARAHY|nr:hypothetical protein Ahy_A04g020874 [Arachis hypogaea]
MDNSAEEVARKNNDSLDYSVLPSEDRMKKYDASFLILLETHISSEKGRKFCEKLYSNRFFVEEARGFTGGDMFIEVLKEASAGSYETTSRILVQTMRRGNSEAKINHLPILKSDHTPLCLQPSTIEQPNKRRRPFRCLATWITHSYFGNLVTNNWRVNNT